MITHDVKFIMLDCPCSAETFERCLETGDLTKCAQEAAAIDAQLMSEKPHGCGSIEYLF